ncbi:hypothetical protein GGS26DRAFT_511430 [Hypomontagnella submonticulosa]|nr:hypothetical protein GGS26DRAFT_511430 [Hypomontagnella submonticulosa]
MTVSRPPGITTTVEGPLSNSFSDFVPLLSTFTPPESCKDAWVYDVTTEGTVWKDRNYNTMYPLVCHPFNGHNTLYKPGICPNNQEFKLIDVTIESSNGPSPPPTWYMGRCCSTGYKLSYRDHFTEYPECFSGLVPPITATLRDPVKTDTTVPEITTIDLALVAVEEPINIVWAESDLTLLPASVAQSFRALMGLPLETASPTSTSTVVTIVTLTPSSGSAPITNQSDANASSSLSGGVIAGICVGTVAVLALVASALYLGCISRRRKKRAQTRESAGASGTDSPAKKNAAQGQVRMSELQDTQMGIRANPFYVSQRHSELQGSMLAANSVAPVELEGSPLGGSR